jgi:hypothetical protein
MAEKTDVTMLGRTPAIGSPEGITGLSGKEAPGPVRYHHGIGYLRAFVTVLVLAHHALFAYNPAVPVPRESLLSGRSWRAFPIVDAERSLGPLVFNSFTDVFFMSLMFFVSGLFVWGSLRRKGGAVFLRDRLVRLGVPFAIAAAAIAPIAYYPAYLAMAPAPAPLDYARQWLALGEWPAGPAWFIWVLLLFNALAAAAARVAPAWGERVARRAGPLLHRPTAFLLALAAASAAVYVPMSLAVGPGHWTTLGPFAFQTSRLGHYALYFVAGIVVGARGFERGPLGADAKLASRWPLWLAGAGIAFVLFVFASGGSSFVMLPGTSPVAFALTFSLSCAASSLGLTAVFLRFADGPSRVLDSLRDNAYAMYLIHFPCSNWIQYFLLGAALSAGAKAVLAFTGTLLVSWAAAALLRRVTVIRRVI